MVDFRLKTEGAKQWRVHGDAPETEAVQPENYWSGLARLSGQGIFGIGDEVTALLRQLGSDASYDDLLAEERAAIEQFRKTNPGSALTAEILTGLAVPGMMLMRALKGAKALKTGALTAAEGGAFGAGYAEGDLVDRAKGAIGTAAVAGGVGVGTQKALQLLANKMAAGPSAAANKIILQALEDSGVDIRDYLPNQGLTAERRLRNPNVVPLGPGDVLGDAPELAGLGFASLKFGRTRAQNALEARQKEINRGVMGELTSVFDTYDIPADEHLIRMAEQLEITSPQRYGNAYEFYPMLSVSEDLPGFFGRQQPDAAAAVLQGKSVSDVSPLTPFIRDSYASARETIDELIEGGVEGWTELDRLPKDITEFVNNDRITMRSAHQIAKNMGNKAFPKRGADNVDEEKLLAYKARRRKYVEQLKAKNPVFAEAVKPDELFYLQREAIDMGEKFMGKSSAEIQKILSDFDPVNRDLLQKAYRSGMLKKISDMRPTETGTLSTHIRNHEKIKEKLQATFPNRADYNRFLMNVERLARQRKTHEWLFAGSQTAPRQQQQSGALGAAHAAAEGLYFDPVYPVVKGVRYFMKRNQWRFDKKVLMELQRKLITDPRGAQAMLLEVLEGTAPREAGKFRRFMAAEGAASIGMGEVGSNMPDAALQWGQEKGLLNPTQEWKNLLQ